MKYSTLLFVSTPLDLFFFFFKEQKVGKNHILRNEKGKTHTYCIQ